MTHADATGIILFAHGSRDPLWRAPIDAVALAIARQHPQMQVRCAFLELTDPDLNTALTELVGVGMQHIRIVPMFLGTGKHAREDLPELVCQLRERYPSIGIELLGPIGEHPDMIRQMAEIAAGQIHLI